jgi:hypothetical protein
MGINDYCDLFEVSLIRSTSVLRVENLSYFLGAYRRKQIQ